MLYKLTHREKQIRPHSNHSFRSHRLAVGASDSALCMDHLHDFSQNSCCALSNLHIENFSALCCKLRCGLCSPWRPCKLCTRPPRFQLVLGTCKEWTKHEKSCVWSTRSIHTSWQLVLYGLQESTKGPESWVIRNDLGSQAGSREAFGSWASEVLKAGVLARPALYWNIQWTSPRNRRRSPPPPPLRLRTATSR